MKINCRNGNHAPGGGSTLVFLQISPPTWASSNISRPTILAQFHDVYDDLFETVYAPNSEAPFEWSDLFMHSRDVPTAEIQLHAPDLGNKWLTEDELRRRKTMEDSIRGRRTRMQHPDRDTRSTSAPDSRTQPTPPVSHLNAAPLQPTTSLHSAPEDVEAQRAPLEVAAPSHPDPAPDP